MDLSQKKCRPCEGGMKPLDPAQARALVAQVSPWKLRKDEPRLWREFTFKDFVRAIKFVNKVAELAEAEGHHPDVHIHYNRVKLVLWTHDLEGRSEEHT